jgi:hypothetical protein
MFGGEVELAGFEDKVFGTSDHGVMWYKEWGRCWGGGW